MVCLGAIKDLGSQEEVNPASGFEFKRDLGLRLIHEEQKVTSTLPVDIMPSRR